MKASPPPAEPPPPADIPPPAAPAPAQDPAAPATWPEWFRTADAVLAVLLMIPAFLVASHAARNSDLWPHLAAGRLIAEGKYEFGTDPFSHATAGRTWVNHSWLLDILAYKLYAIGPAGGAILVGVKAAGFALAIAFLLLIRRPGRALWPWVAFGGLAIVAAAPHTGLRPIVASAPFLAATLFVLLRLDWHARPVLNVAVLAGLFWLWANLDAWFVLGPLAVALVLLGEVLQGVILKGTARDMKDRYQSAMEFSAALDRAMDRIQATMDKTVVLPPPKPDVVPGSNRLALLSVLAVLFLGSVVAAWIYLKPGTPDAADTAASLTVESQTAQGKKDPEAKPGNDKTSDIKKEEFSKVEDRAVQTVTAPEIDSIEAQPSTAVADTSAVELPVTTRPVPIVVPPDPEKERLAEAARAEEDVRIRAEEVARVDAERAAEERRKEVTRQKAALAAASDAKNLVPRAKPAMVSIAGGKFSMGCGAPDTACLDAEKPVHTVTVKSFKLSKHEVTFDQYDAFAAATGRAKPDDKGWGRGSRPVINVNWEDANAFVTWLAKQTREPFRLPTEAEWEYAARAGTSTVYLWGNEIGFGLANCTGCGSNFDGDRTSPVGTFAASKFGLHDMHGNVWEWVQDCWQDGYAGAPTDCSARMTGNCSSRILRGGSWLNNPSYLRVAYRNWLSSNLRDVNTGFRVARD